MSSFGLFLVVVGVVLILGRGPLLFAPQATRSLYLKMVENDLRMRAWGVFATLLGAAAMFLSRSATGFAAAAAFWLGLVVAILALASVFVFPSEFRAFAHKTWARFNSPVLRVFGLVSIGFGALLIVYGLGH